MSTGAIVGAIWFVVNTVILLLVGVYVYKNNSKSNNFCQDFIQQRRIYTSLIVLFLDQATDIGVLISWYILMNDDIDYVSLNLYSFFWPLLGFFILYQVIMMFAACDSTALYDIILVIFQIYPYKTAYISLVESYKIMDTGIQKNMQNAMQVRQKTGDEKDEEIDITSEPVEDDSNVDTLTKQQVIYPGQEQDKMLLIQCILETLPGLVLQAVFWVRSFNDPILRTGSDNGFIVFSIIASIISVSWRYIAIVDFQCVTEKAMDKCYNLWYIIRVTYRISSIIASFIVFVMIWVVIGGIWIGLWIVLTFIGWNIAAVINGELVCTAWSLGSAVKNMIGLTMEYTLKYHIIKFCENLIGMCLIFLFLWTSFDCGVCVSGDTREAYRGDNSRIAFLFALGWCCSVGSFALYVFMYLNGAIKNKKD